ncbi:MAG: response regulator, partial [Anaerolineales bacterium]|nr:response regulator [Anaerolineales bacterium]
RRQAERTEALARLSQALAEAAADYAAVVATAVHWGAAGVGDGCVLYLLSEDGAWLEPAASDHIDPEARDYLRQVLASARYSAQGSFNTQLLRGAGPVILADLTPEQVHALAQPGTPDWLERYSLSSLVAVPLRAQGETIGTFLTARQEAGRPYTQEDAHFIQEVADRAALAIVNARLLARIQRQNSELEQRVAERTADLSHVNAELQRTARAKDEFLASMSHELRTPLNAVLTLTEALADDVYGPVTDRQRRPLQLIGESGQHLLTLINDVLDLAKIEAGKLELQPMWVEVEALCQASLRLVRQQALKKRLQTTVEVGMEVRSLMADGRRLKQMLVNLLDNAVKFTPEGGQIGLEVRGDAAAGVARFTVWDTGIGIPAEDAQRLFQPFVQVQSGLDRQYGGTGLGLSLVYRMAELHGGGVGLQSVPGQGSRFTLSLPWRVNAAGPAAEPAGAEAAPAPASAPVSQPGKVLIADDNRVNQVAFADYLTFRGYQVVLAADGEEALARARADHPDIILIDVQMPRLNGLEAVRRLRADPELAGLPVIALTALAMEGDRERCLAAGADEYLAKPVNLPQLERVIEAQLKRAARRRP